MIFNDLVTNDLSSCYQLEAEALLVQCESHSFCILLYFVFSFCICGVSCGKWLKEKCEGVEVKEPRI